MLENKTFRMTFLFHICFLIVNVRFYFAYGVKKEKSVPFSTFRSVAFIIEKAREKKQFKIYKGLQFVMIYVSLFLLFPVKTKLSIISYYIFISAFDSFTGLLIFNSLFLLCIC